jgi:hypothetical protein
MYDDSKEVQSVSMVSENLAHVSYADRKEFVQENSASNLFVCIWTTSQARLHLYSFMEAVIKGGGIVCYNDTDSVILAHKSSEKCPIEAGPFLGDMSDEYAHHRIMVS